MSVLQDPAILIPGYMLAKSLHAPVNLASEAIKPKPGVAPDGPVPTQSVFHGPASNFYKRLEYASRTAQG